MTATIFCYAHVPANLCSHHGLFRTEMQHYLEWNENVEQCGKHLLLWHKTTIYYIHAYRNFSLAGAVHVYYNFRALAHPVYISQHNS